MKKDRRIKYGDFCFFLGNLVKLKRNYLIDKNLRFL